MTVNKIVLIIPFLCLVFLWEMVLQNKVPLAQDSISHFPIKKWAENLEEKSDVFPHWFSNLFSGMPAYGSYINTSGDPTGLQTQKFFFDNKGLRMWFWLSIGGIGLYYFLIFKKISLISSLFGGIGFSLTPHIFGLINAGHNNKIMAMALIPWLFFAVSYLFQEKSFKSVLFLSLISAFQLWMNHPQIVYYSWMFISAWWFYNFLIDYKNRKSNVSIRLLILLVGSIFISSLMVVDPYLDIFTFQKHSNRGAPSVLDETNETSSGTKWDYATQWSFHPAEVISFLFPYHFGLQNFSVKNRTNPSVFMKQASYWGYMPFTQSTHYMGLLVLLLPLISLVIRFQKKEFDYFENFLWIISLIFLLIGFGKHLPILYQLLFDYAPFFSKFRIPSMIYIVLIFSFSYLSASALDYITNSNKIRLISASQIVLGTFVAASFLLFLFGENLLSFNAVGDTRFPNYINFVQTIRVDYFNKGLILALVISISTLALIWSYSKDKLNKNIFLSLIVGVLVFDLWVLDREFLSLTEKKNFNNQFIKDSKIDYMLADNDNFRIFPADEISTNYYSYWNLQSIGGYRAVKLRNYQDLMDIGGFRRPEILNMLNVKYLLTRKKVQNNSFKKIEGVNNLYENVSVLPKAWLVGDIHNVDNQKASLTKVMNIGFKPKNTAIVYNYGGPLLSGSSDGIINIISYYPNNINIQTDSDNGALLVLSELYYEPGWKCKVNGKLSPIYQTNHVLRSVYLPEGKNKVQFFYDAKNWELAKIISRSSFYGVLILLLLFLFRDRQNKLL